MKREFIPIIQRSIEIFNKKMYTPEPGSSENLVCSLNDAFQDYHTKGHNCLGCNLQDDVNLISHFLKSATIYDEIHQTFRVYVMTLYLLVEKYFEIKKIIGLPQEYKQSEMEVFNTIKLWANFFKHPKAFILVHHPEFYFDTKDLRKHINKENGHKIIDIDFLNKYYKGEDANKYKNLISELKNNPNVKVIIPRLDKLTEQFCNASKMFICIIKENKVYREMLNDISTLENYYDIEYRSK